MRKKAPTVKASLQNQTLRQKPEKQNRYKAPATILLQYIHSCAILFPKVLLQLLPSLPLLMMGVWINAIELVFLKEIGRIRSHIFMRNDS